MHDEQRYGNAKLNLIEIGDISIGLREFGAGTDILLIHGFPTHGYTWRKIIQQLSGTYKCHVVDLPGLGDSTWSARTDFKSEAQAAYLLALMDKRNIKNCSLVAHNSGATVARVMAIKRPDLIDKLVLINTEIPDHRPPWIPFYQKIGLLPLAPDIIKILTKQRWFQRSPMGFKEAYSDKRMFNDSENLGPYLEPLIASRRKMIGAFKYLRGIDWGVVDRFKEQHRSIKADTLLIWGEDDKTFPVELGEQMVAQFQAHCELKRIKNASLLPHEEKPFEVGKLILEFLEN